MKKLLICLLFIFSLSFYSYSQNIEKYDTILTEACYTSYYSYNIQAPSFVIYKLYNGGGNVSRSGMSFKAKRGFKHFSYTNSNYDRGHLCPAEDFAYDKKLMKSTFYYHNAIPQTARLNRGIWKTFEGVTRKESKLDSLLVICGGCNYDNTLIPKKCFKVVYSLSTHQMIYCILVVNDNMCGLEYNNPVIQNTFSFDSAIDLYLKKND